MRELLNKACPAVLLFSLTAAAGLHAAQLSVQGRVVDENGLAVHGAKLTISGGAFAEPAVTFTDEAGRFVFPDVPPGEYHLQVEKLGFYAFVSRPSLVVERATTLEIRLNHEQEYEERVDVVYSAPIIDRHEASSQTTLKASQIIDLPFPASHDFRNALPMIPGVVKDNRGRIRMNGGAEDQVYYALDGFNIAGPASGILENRLSVDALRAVRVESSRYSVEFGKGSAGTIAMESSRGDDQFRYSATNFLPSYEFHNGLVLSNWNPRATVSGPILAGRVWYFNALDLQYDLNVVDALPADANRSRSWYGSNLTRIQANLNPRNILTASFLLNFQESRHYGLNALAPKETTRNRHNRLYFFSLKNEAYPGGWFLESGLAVNRTRNRETPLGRELYTIRPDGLSGNYFLRSEGSARRVQVLVNAHAPAKEWHGRHLIKFGVDANVIDYRQNSDRRPFEVLRRDGTRVRRVSFTGEPGYENENFEFGAHLKDRWALSERVMLENGLRLDWDSTQRRWLWSPRTAATWSPRGSPDTKLSAGLGIFRDATNLALVSRRLDQARIETFFGPDGKTVAGGPVRTSYHGEPSGLTPPLYLNASLGWEQKLPRGFYFRTNLIHRRGNSGWTYAEAEPAAQTDPADRRFVLSGSRRDRYSLAELTLTRTFAEKYPWMLSYARSRARSSAAIDFSLENPLFAGQTGGPLDWDVPHRLISWAFLPAPWLKKYTLTYVLEWHTGFPFTVVNERQAVLGAPNSRRFPDYFSLNLHVERRFKMWRYQWALRAGFNNITGHRNPVVVVNNIDSPNFREFDRGQGRAFTGRIRLIGRN